MLVFFVHMAVSQVERAEENLSLLIIVVFCTQVLKNCIATVVLRLFIRRFLAAPNLQHVINRVADSTTANIHLYIRAIRTKRVLPVPCLLTNYVTVVTRYINSIQ